MKQYGLRKLLPLLWGEALPLLLSALSAVVSVVCTLLAPLAIGGAIDHMAGAHRVDFVGVGRYLAALALLYAGSNGFLWLLTMLTNRLAYRTASRLRGQLFRRLHTLPLEFFDRNPHGDTISRFVGDVDMISDGMLQGSVVLLSGGVTIVGATLCMLSRNLEMTVIVVLSAPLSIAVARALAKHSQQSFRAQAEQVGALNGFAEEMIQGHTVVRAFGYEERAMETFHAQNQRLYQVGFRAQLISALSNPSTRIVLNLAYAVIGILGGIAAIEGRITVGDISSFLLYSTIFTKPFNDITNVLGQLQSASASARRVFQTLEQPPETPDAADAVTLQHCRGQVRFDDVTFSYVPEVPLIAHFMLEVPAGSTVAIVGHTGAGKTTLMNLLLRFYELRGGRITIDGVDIRRMRRDSLRGLFGMVLQDSWIFDGSIRDNIAYARPDASREEVIAVARAAGADGFIRRLEHGYDTVIDAAGESISQGQRQLLTIARVMLADAPMLILDEATSSIDTSTELHIQHAFARMMQGRTCFIIAHRLSTVKNADQILMMEGGAVVEQGRHAELLARGGAYARLYHAQFDQDPHA